MLKRIVDGLQVIALGLVVVTIGMLFRAGPEPEGAAAFDSVGARVFSANCALCHGADGSGGLGPSLLTGNVLDRLPDRLSTMAFIEVGQDKMPGFGDRLTPGEIGAVTDFVRMKLATEG